MAVSEGEIIFTEPGKGVFLDTLIPGINVLAWDDARNDLVAAQVNTRVYCDPQSVYHLKTSMHKASLGKTQKVARIVNDNQRSNNWALEWVVPEQLKVGDALVTVKMREHKPMMDRVIEVSTGKGQAKMWELMVAHHRSYFVQGILVSNQREDGAEHAQEGP